MNYCPWQFLVSLVGGSLSWLEMHYFYCFPIRRHVKKRSEGTGLLQMVIRRGRPLTNDHLEGSSSKRRNWGFQNSWAFICFLREKYMLGEESIIFYVWSHAQSKVYNVKITKPKVKRRLRTRSPLRRYPASFSGDAGKGTKLRGRNLLSFWQLLFLCYFL